tara:strand:+ start:403 stop:627 length:225 start_codon:yes stop_codon:yes gene_type:complete
LINLQSDFVLIVIDSLSAQANFEGFESPVAVTNRSCFPIPVGRSLNSAHLLITAFEDFELCCVDGGGGWLEVGP